MCYFLQSAKVKTPSPRGVRSAAAAICGGFSKLELSISLYRTDEGGFNVPLRMAGSDKIAIGDLIQGGDLAREALGERHGCRLGGNGVQKRIMEKDSGLS